MASLDSIEGDLGADQVDEEGYCCEDGLLLEVDGHDGLCYLGHEPAEGLEGVD